MVFSEKLSTAIQTFSFSFLCSERRNHVYLMKQACCMSVQVKIHSLWSQRTSMLCKKIQQINYSKDRQPLMASLHLVRFSPHILPHASTLIWSGNWWLSDISTDRINKFIQVYKIFLFLIPADHHEAFYYKNTQSQVLCLFITLVICWV